MFYEKIILNFFKIDFFGKRLFCGEKNFFVEKSTF